MQSFIAYGRVADIPVDGVGKTAKGHTSFKFEFVCDSNLMDDNGKPIPSFFHVQVYGKQAEVMVDSLSKGSPILLKGEIIQRPYTNAQGERRIYQYVAPSQHDGITFLENRKAAKRRKQGLFNTSQPVTNPTSSYPEPVDAEEPF